MPGSLLFDLKVSPLTRSQVVLSTPLHPNLMEGWPWGNLWGPLQIL